MLALNQNSSPNHRFTIYRGADNRFHGQAFTATNVILPLANNGPTISTNTWYHVAAAFYTSGGNPTLQTYINGSSQGTATVGAENTLNEILIGARRGGGAVGLYWDGQLAECAVYDTDLTDDEIASLADGMTCDKVRPQSLVFYAPLVRNLQDVKGGLTITNNNTATVANHPRVYA